KRYPLAPMTTGYSAPFGTAGAVWNSPLGSVWAPAIMSLCCGLCGDAPGLRNTTIAFGMPAPDAPSTILPRSTDPVDAGGAGCTGPDGGLGDGCGGVGAGGAGGPDGAVVTGGVGGVDGVVFAGGAGAPGDGGGAPGPGAGGAPAVTLWKY